MTKTNKTKLQEELLGMLSPLTSNCVEEKAIQAKLLIDNIAFMAVELASLREDISKNGTVMMIENGNKVKTLNANPSVRVYNSLMKTFTNALDQLRKILPETASAGSALMDFIKNGKPEA